MRFHLRTLLILLALGPPLLAGAWFVWRSYDDAILDWIGGNYVHL